MWALSNNLNLFVSKLDGVDPVDYKPSTNYPHHIVQETYNK